MIKRLKNQNGSALLITLIIMLMLTLIFAAAVMTSVTDVDIAKNQKEKTFAFYTAEAGLQLAIGVLRQNFNELNNAVLESLVNINPVIGNGNFGVNVTGTSPYKTLTSSGLNRDGKTTVQVTVKRKKSSLCIWDNIIFAGTGQAGGAINGNVNMHGSVHILGENLVDGDVAMEMSGSGNIHNNYSGITSALSSRLPALDTTTFNGEVVNTLDAELRVKKGLVNISGSSYAGFPDVPGGSPLIKETLDGTYVTDGYGGNKGDIAVHSDNGTGQGYDLGDAVNLPDLNDSYTDPNTGTTYPTYMNYLQSNALVISGDLTLKPGQTYSTTSNGFGSISMDAAGNLQINGIVYITGDISIDAGHGGMNHTPVIFDGNGSLVSQGDISISTHVLSNGTFPTDDVLGFIAGDDINIGTGSGDAHLNIMGAFFAEDQITNKKQNQLAGAMVSNYFQIDNVPDLFHVPSLVDHLPPGMPGSETVDIYTYKIVSGTWREL
ncbi:MAG: pilus assembly PilX N-terminal domain-containing protein [Candidatus Zixiibacteriota bacterium]